MSSSWSGRSASPIARDVQLEALDLIVIAAYLGLILVWAARHTRRAGESTEQFFVAGRSLPWWLAGISIVATTFAADTPLAIAGLVATEGIAGNWFWWADVLPAMLAAILIAHLWRRSGVMTDNELVEIRYGGRPAAALRLFRALYFGVLRNAIVLGWVNLAMLKVLQLTLGLDEEASRWALLALFGFTVVYTWLSGLWGVVITDTVQFVLAMAGSILLAIVALGSLGGLTDLLGQLHAVYGPEAAERTLALVPTDRDGIWAFVIYVAVKGWASGNTEGSGYIAQRLLATRSERDARLAAITYAIANFVLRPWPWILVGLVALVTDPGLVDPETGYVRVMLRELPVGLRGLMLATLLAAFMSTVDTHLNWGASYLTHDVYRRFVNPSASERTLVRVARGSVIGLAALGVVATFAMPSIAGAWKFLASITAGTGLIVLLRWLWWRINAWTEIAVMATSLLMTNVLLLFWELPYPFSLVIVVAVALPVAFGVTFLTAPEGMDRLGDFYTRVRPRGWWRPVTDALDRPHAPLGVKPWLLVAGATLGTYGLLLGTGELLLGGAAPGLVALAVGGILIAAVIVRSGSEPTA